jgi:hypothetical protein
LPGRDLRGAIKVQSAYRGHVERQSFLRTKRAAIKVQQTARMHLQRVAYTAAWARPIQLQAVWRGFSGHKAFLRSKAAAMSMQSHFRGRQARLHVKAVRAAIKVQSAYRGHDERQSFLRTKWAAIKEQATARIGGDHDPRDAVAEGVTVARRDGKAPLGIEHELGDAAEEVLPPLVARQVSDFRHVRLPPGR